MQRIVVVGAGQAGAALVAKLRSLGHTGPITLIGDEPAPPYQRPPLSKKYLLGEMSLERLYLRPESFYAEHDVALRLGQPVTAIDRAARTVRVGAEDIAYDALALTTGALPRRLPSAIGGELPGVYLMRTLADADRMEPEFRPGRRVLIVGGGYIGLEAAAVAASRGLQVTLIEATPRILGRVAAPETADFFRELHRSHGVDIREGAGLVRLVERDGRVGAAMLADGAELAVDFVIVGIGIAPDTRLAEAAGPDDSTTASPSTSDAAPRIRRSGRRVTAPRSPGVAAGCGSNRCRTRSTRPSTRPRPCWARTLPTCPRPGSGRTSTTASCRSPGCTPDTPARSLVPAAGPAADRSGISARAGCLPSTP